MTLILACWLAAPLCAQSIDHSTGFSSTAGLVRNGSATFAPPGASTAVRLTDNVGGQAGSIWHSTPVNVQAFTTSFTFRFSGGGSLADGMTFTLQNSPSGSSAVGPGGSSLGYEGISSSVCVTFDIWGGSPTLSDLFTNGAGPYSTTSLYPTLNFQSGNVFRCDMTYGGSTLALTITDTATQATYSRTHTVNIPALVGGSTALAGFTGGTGGLSAAQDILTWSYNLAPGGVPTGVAAAPALPGDGAVITWNAVGGATTYSVSRAPLATGPFSPIGTSTIASFADPSAAPGATYAYVVSATTAAGTSANSTPPAEVTLPGLEPESSESADGPKHPCGLAAGGAGLLPLAILLSLAFPRAARP